MRKSKSPKHFTDVPRNFVVVTPDVMVFGVRLKLIRMEYMSRVIGDIVTKNVLETDHYLSAPLLLHPGLWLVG